MSPYAKAILSYHRGNTETVLEIIRDDGEKRAIPVSHLYETGDFPELENHALAACRGTVLDGGAGAGRHALALRARGLQVLAVDIEPALCTVLAQRGINAVTADLLAWTGPRVDTLLMLKNGIGMTGTPARLDAFLSQLGTMLEPGGQLLCDSIDVLSSRDPARQAYGRANLATGRYPGQHAYRIFWGGEGGAAFDWLHLSYGCLARHCGVAGLSCELLRQGPDGHYLARVALME